MGVVLKKLQERKCAAVKSACLSLISTLRRLLFATIVLMGIISTSAGCAYFNTFYNAERYYKQGLKKEEVKKGAGKQEFKKSLEKAVIVARDYADSRWVDDAFFLIAMNYYWMRNYEKSAAQFEGFLNHFSDSPFTEEAGYYYALTFIELKRYSEGRLALQQMFASRRFGPDARFHWSLAFKKEEDWDGASSAFKEFLDTYPRGEFAGDARLHLAEIELAGGDTLSAIGTYERYLKRAETSKENLQRFFTLADLYYFQKNYPASRRTLKKMKGIYIQDVDERGDLLTAKIELAEGDSVRAEKLLVEIPRGDHRGEAFFILASLYEIQEKSDLALAYYDTVVTHEKRSDYVSLAQFKKSLLQARVARPDSADTTEVDPAREQFRLAEEYFLSFGDFGRALQEYTRVVDAYPESKYAPKALYGIVWLKKYRLNDTLWGQDLDSLLRLYPESKAAEEACQLLGYEEVSSDST